MLALTLRWRMRRLVKKSSMNVATLQADFMASPGIADRDAAPLLPSTRGGREMPISVAHAGVAEVSGKLCELLRPSFAMPVEQRPDGKAMAEVVHAGPVQSPGAAARSLWTIAR